jgi:hypothetical protein
VTAFSRSPATLAGAVLTLGHQSMALRKVSERGTVAQKGKASFGARWAARTAMADCAEKGG